MEASVDCCRQMICHADRLDISTVAPGLLPFVDSTVLTAVPKTTAEVLPTSLCAHLAVNDDTISFEEWLTRLAQSMARFASRFDGKLGCLASLAALDVRLSKDLLVDSIARLLECSVGACVFFGKLFNQLISFGLERCGLVGQSNKDERWIRFIVELLVKFLPALRANQSKSSQPKVDIDFSGLAQLADFVQMYHVAVYSVYRVVEDFRCDRKGVGLKMPTYAYGHLDATKTEGGRLPSQLSTVLCNAYIGLKHCDHLIGLGDQVLALPKSRIFLALSSRNWQRLAQLVSEDDLDRSVIPAEFDRCRSLDRAGIATGDAANADCALTDFQYECAWRLGRWGDASAQRLPQRIRPQTMMTDDDCDGHNRWLFVAGHSLADGRPDSALAVLSAGVGALAEKLNTCDVLTEHALCLTRSVGLLDTLRTFVRATTQLSTTHTDVEATSARLVASTLVGGTGALTRLKKINCVTSALRALMHCEDRRSPTAAVAVTDRRDSVVAALASSVRQEVALMRQLGLQRKALRTIGQLESNFDTVVSVTGGGAKEKLRPVTLAMEGVRLEKAHCLLADGERALAGRVLTSIVDRLKVASFSGRHEENDDRERQRRLLLAETYVTMGEMVGETPTEGGDVDGARWFADAADVLRLSMVDDECGGDEAALRVAAQAHFTIADAMDNRYQQMESFLHSTEHKEFLETLTQMKDNKTAADRLNPSTVTRRELEAHRRQRLTISEDEARLSEMHRKRGEWLVAAARHYLECLARSSRFDMAVFRVVSLWFDNLAVVELAKLIQLWINKIPTYKWLPTWNQIVSRLTTFNQPSVCPLSKNLIAELVLKTACDHPYHCFYNIFYMSSEQYGQNKSAESQGRYNAAKQIMQRMKKYAAVASVVQNLNLLTDAYLKLAELKPDTRVKDLRSLSCFKSLVEYSLLVPLPSVSVTVDPSGSYPHRDLVCVSSFCQNYKFADGNSRPIILTVVCSDGVKRKLLLKSGEDVRQDAVMEQVIDVVNRLLSASHHSAAAEECDRMRTYVVVPLNPHTGIIEWCADTIPLGNYLIGEHKNAGAHKFYHPDDKTAAAARSDMQKAYSANASKEAKMTLFDSICMEMRPVLRHFFYERFANPVDWWRARNAYTASLAVCCMVGHIIGLGDRHTSNVLIDETTGELIQIDLGLVWEEGRTLTVPERVPFRLTRDLLDPLAVCGAAEGAFVRRCRRTMTVLRAARRLLTAVVGVLLHDPVANWQLTDTARHKRQPPQTTQQRQCCRVVMCRVQTRSV